MRPTKRELAVLSQQYTNKHIASICGVNPQTITAWQKQESIPALWHKPRISRETFEALSPTHTDKQIAEVVGLPVRKVNYWRNKWGIPSYSIPKGNRLYTIDHEFFHRIDSEEKAYILGLIAADGSIHRNGRTIDIALHPRDKPILERIRTALRSTAPIYTRNEGSRSPRVGVYLCSKRLIEDLIALGITPTKSLTLTYPVIANDYERHYIRGIWDGDGWIGPRQFSLAGSYSSLHGVQQTIINATGCLLTLTPLGKIFRLQGSRRDKQALSWIYANSMIVFARKYERFLTYWQ